jgi:hypothetical protein
MKRSEECEVQSEESADRQVSGSGEKADGGMKIGRR